MSKMRTRKIAGTAFAFALLLGATGALGATAASATDNSDAFFDTPQQEQLTQQLDPAEVALLESDIPKVVEIDMMTGAATSVKEDNNQAQARGVFTNDCSSGKACWLPFYAGANAYGFNGTTTFGSWLQRGSFKTNNYAASICFSFAGSNTCSVRTGKNTTIPLVYPATGTRVTLG